MSLLEKRHIQSVDEVIAEAIARERQLQKFYEKAVDAVGPEASLTMAGLCSQHDVRIHRLEELAEEIDALRELTSSIAD